MKKSSSTADHSYAIVGLGFLGLLFLASCWFFIKSTLLLQEHANEIYGATIPVVNSTQSGVNVQYSDPLITVVPDDQQSAQNKTKVFISTLDPILGTSQAKVYIIIFGNFTDSQAETYLQYAKDIQTEFGDDVAIVWKEYIASDDDSDDERALAMSTFAHCANEQQVFWEYVTVLRDRAADDNTTLLQLAEQIGAERYTVEDCVNLSGYPGMIQQSFYTAEKLGVQNSHTVFINDDMYSDPVSYDDLVSKIRAVLESY